MFVRNFVEEKLWFERFVDGLVLRLVVLNPNIFQIFTRFPNLGQKKPLVFVYRNNHRV